MSTPVEELVTTLLWEGYALYPYTPGATKNATPTPFGIVYPPVYAAGSPTTFERIRMQAIVVGGADAALSLSVRFLESAGERNEAVAREVELPATALAALEGDGAGAAFAFARVRGAVRMAAQRFDETLVRVTFDVRNETAVAAGLDRAEALRFSLLSTQLLARVRDGRFLSPVAPPPEAAAAVMACAAVNTFPVLASDADDALLGAAIALPDHPSSPPRAAATCSTRPRSRRRCCCTCSRSATTSASRRRRTTRPCARCSRAPSQRRPRRSSRCTAA